MNYHLFGEWFKYDQEVINAFKESFDDPPNKPESKEDYAREFILYNLVPTPEILSDLYMDKILLEVKEQSESYTNLYYEEDKIKSAVLEVFNFVSSKEREYFKSLNLDSFLADPNVASLGTDISIDLPQIAGRQRNRENPFKNEITIFYRTQKNPVSREDFEKLQEKRKRSTDIILSGFGKLSDVEKSEFIEKIKDSIQVKSYSGDFVAISEKTNLPIYNYLIDIANERAWEVSQKDYQDKISDPRALRGSGFGVGDYLSENDQVVKDFLNNHFYGTGIFEKKMKMYCEFRDTYGGDSDMMRSLDHKIQDPKYKMYYDYYGTSGCRAVSYKEAFLYRGWKDKTRDRSSELERIVRETFKAGERYPMSEIKTTLQGIYDSVGISGKAKATDLGGYFKLSKTRITLPDKNVVNGFKLEDK